MSSWYRYLKDKTMSDFKCPYCGEMRYFKYDIIVDDYESVECRRCKKSFLVYCSGIDENGTKEYKISMPNCINNGNHKWRSTTIHLRRQEFYCQTCHRRERMSWKETMAICGKERLKEELLDTLEKRIKERTYLDVVGITLDKDKDALLFERAPEILLDLPVTITDRTGLQIGHFVQI